MSGTHQFVSRLTGETTEVRVRRKVVDATYLETSVPSTHTPTFGVDPNVRLIPINDLVRTPDPGSGYTVIGAGKTAMDACSWLLDNRVPPEAIRWIRPRDAWLLNRAATQPLALVSNLIEGVANELESAANAENVDDLFARLEASGQLLRLDPTITPTMYRCATVSDRELESLRRIENVVRKGRVVHISADAIQLDEGSVPTDAGQIHVDCTADGLKVAAARPIFEPDHITLQQVRTCQPTFNAALLAYIETARDDDDEKNRLCPPNPYPSANTDWIAATSIAQHALGEWQTQPDLVTWMRGARLDAARRR